jgi:NADPH:quinone reductase-like Zn-dependent oxidoreductase
MRLGAHAEYTCLPENGVLTKKPKNTTHEQAVAVIFGGLTAIHFLRDQVTLQNGHRVLINGASGAVGTAAIQLAKYLGAEVTGICSTGNRELVISLGAQQVIDYTREDFRASANTYDLILDTVGNMTLANCKGILAPKGKLILLNTGLIGNVLSIFQKKVLCGVAGESKENLEYLSELIEGGAIKPVIDRVYPLHQVADAHKYVDTGRKRGNVVITVEHP